MALPVRLLLTGCDAGARRSCGGHQSHLGHLNKCPDMQCLLRHLLQVMKLVPGGTGEDSGLIFVGDKLRFVDGVDVTKITAAEFTELIMGPNGSTVTLSFQKPSVHP